MTISAAGLDSFASLATAIGLLDDNGQPNTAWFEDPLGEKTATSRGLKTVLADDKQRAALEAFVDEVLGPPEGHAEGGVTWIPLFARSSPTIAIYAVLETGHQTVAKEDEGSVRISVAVQHTTTSLAKDITSTVTVPLFQLPRRGQADKRPKGGALPTWTLIGRPEGVVTIGVDAHLDDTPAVPGVAHLGGIDVAVGVPTAAGGTPTFSLTLRDLQMPGAQVPQTRTLDLASFDTIGHEVLEFVVGLIRQQIEALPPADANAQRVVGLSGILGIAHLGRIPPFPLEQLPTEGLTCVVAWIESILNDPGALQDWMDRLATLLKGAPAAGRPGVTFSLGGADITVGLRVTPGVGGHPVLVPWLELSWSPTAGAQLAATVDILRADTATGAVSAVPSLRAEAILGAIAPADAKLLTGSPSIGAVRTGIALDAHRTLAFTLLLDDVDLGPGKHYDVLDLSSPGAAMDAIEDVVADTLRQALNQFHGLGDLINVVIGLDPPGTVTAISVPDLFSDPLGTLRDYWSRLVANPTAMASALGTVRQLVLGGVHADVPGTGDPETPWRIDLTDGIGLRAWSEKGSLVASFGARVETEVLDGVTIATDISLALARIDLVAGHASFACEAAGAISLHPSGTDPLVLDLEIVHLAFHGAGLQARWRPGHAIAVAVLGDGLTLTYAESAMNGAASHTIPLPTINPDGSVDFAPDWDVVQDVLAALLGRLGVPVIDAVLAFIGWSGEGAELALADVLADPENAVTTWAVAAVLDCDTLHSLLSPVAAVLSAGALTEPRGSGSPNDPYVCPVGGSPAAPGLIAWTVPGCPPESPETTGGRLEDLRDGYATPEGAEIALRLVESGTAIHTVGDLVVARESLGDGLESLIARWTGTDGVVPAPSTVPTGVTSATLDGLVYDELVARARLGALDLSALGPLPPAVVHVSSDDGWLYGRDPSHCIDATVVAPRRLPDTGAGTWFVRVPRPSAAGAARVDGDGVAGQAERLVEVLTGRAEPVHVVAYGAAGAAAIRASAALVQVPSIVTVGTPWSPASVEALATGHGGDALRLLECLLPEVDPDWGDEALVANASPISRVTSLVRHARTVQSSSDLPSAGLEPRHAGLKVHAVFGSADADDVARGVAALVVDGAQRRRQAQFDDLLASAGAPQELHVGVAVPVLDIPLGPILLGAGATVDLISVQSAAPHVGSHREVIVTLRLAVEDGWLVGGPGAANQEIEVRWLEARIHVPLDGSAGHSELVLHDARAFSAYRERWVVRPDADGIEATTALPEVKILLSQIAARVRMASPEMAALLTTLGILRSDGLDVDAIDHLLFDPATTLRPIVKANAAQIASSLRSLLASTASDVAATAFRITAGPARVDIDLAAGTLTGSCDIDQEGIPPVSVRVEMSASGAYASASLGAIDPTSGGLRLVASAGRGPATVLVESRAPRASSTQQATILPLADVPALTSLAATLVPAALLQSLAYAARSLATYDALAAVDAGLAALGVLRTDAESGWVDVILPLGLVQDPAGWFLTRTDPFAALVSGLDALASVVVPTRASGATGWPLTEQVSIGYAVVAGSLHLTADVAIAEAVGTATVTTSVAAGLAVTRTGTVQPNLTASVDIDGTGLALSAGTSITLDLIRASAPGSPIRLVPGGPGLGAAVGVAAASAVKVALDALLDEADEAGTTLVAKAGWAVHELGAGLDLLDGGHFSAARIETFAGNPGAALTAHLWDLSSRALSPLATALNHAAANQHITVDDLGAGTRRLVIGQGPSLHVTIDPAAPSIEFGFSVDLPNNAGSVALEHLRLSPRGVEFSVRGGPFAVSAGPLVLRPVIVARAAFTPSGVDRLMAVGLGVDGTTLDSLEIRWALDSTDPFPAAITRSSDGQETGEDRTVEEVALRALAIALTVASSILTEALDSVLPAKAKTALKGVVFTDTSTPTIDVHLFTDLTDPGRLLVRLQRLGWNCCDVGLGVTFGDVVQVKLVKEPLTGGQFALGVGVTVPKGKSFDFPTGDVKVSLEVNADWINPTVSPGVSIYALTGTSAATLKPEPGFAIAGVGLRFTKTSGPLLSLGSVALDAIAVHAYAQADGDWVGGGAHVELKGLAFAPGGAPTGGVASSIMNDVGSASANNRPAFSPSFAVQKHPHDDDPSISLRAGDLPGPWWIVIQRQLGPLYLDRIGFDTKEVDGHVTEISLLFSGQLSLFGLQAAVDQLSITWHGGDILNISAWSVDLVGLAISADMAGVSLAGGLLKTTDAGVVSYVGMLVGKFATYGLSVFGGYTNDHGHASFFVFGAINGPIGGPPAFFVTGLGGGLGINRGLRIPTDLAGFPDFPFIQALDPAAKPPAKPMEELKRLSEYFPHRMGSFWFAAGVSFTSFALVDGVAVVAVAFDDGLTIDLLGLARMALPRPGAALVSIELALLAHFSTSEGVFMIKAQLTDNSWLLYEDVRLTGGFAFAVWWKGKLAGQFVVTMGGYHPSFHRDGYPDVPRLGIMWKVSDAITIKGESYFALTSEALMAGVGVEATLDFGWVWGSLAFGADAIVYFDPFWYEASAYARITAGITIDVWIGTITISATVGATVSVHGPDFAGHAEFEIGPCTIPFDFGSSRKVAPKLLTWTEFVDKYLEKGANGARALSSTTGRGTLPPPKPQGDAYASSADGTLDRPFLVYAEFDITFTTSIPASAYDHITVVDFPVTIAGGQPVRLGLSPMGAHDLSSTIVIRVEQLDDDGWFPLSTTERSRLEIATSTDAYPVGVWGTPPDPGAAVKAIPQGDVITAGKQVTVISRSDPHSVGPDVDYHQIKPGRRPLPFSVAVPDRKEMLAVVDRGPAPAAPASVEGRLQAAADELFADRRFDAARVARGGHSAVAVAAFRLDRSAPPIMGSLTDGLQLRKGHAGTREELPPEPETEPRDLRRPFVAGYFTGGVPAAQDAARTTVSDRSIKRRTAPSLASVHGRLGLHLPVSLNRVAPPTIAREGTVVASGQVPRTDAPGAVRSFRGATLGSPSLQALVSGLAPSGPGPRAASTPPVPRGSLAVGDVLVLEFPDHALDVDADRRPAIRITGRARVTATMGRAVLADVDVVDSVYAIPRGASHVAIHAGGSVTTDGRSAGWHERSRIARIGSLTAIAAGCALSVDGNRGGPTMQWDNGHSIVQGSREVTTRFVEPVRTVAVALAGTVPSSVVPAQLRLAGARLAVDANGDEVPPVSVSLGEATVLVYSLDPGDAAMSLTITEGADWIACGVIVSNDDAADFARSLAREGLVGTVAPILAVDGAGCSVAWLAPSARRATSPKRVAARRKAGRR